MLVVFATVLPVVWWLLWRSSPVLGVFAGLVVDAGAGFEPMDGGGFRCQVAVDVFGGVAAPPVPAEAASHVG